MRKKVKYDITKYGKNKTFHFSGIGEIDEENLYSRRKKFPIFLKKNLQQNSTQ